MNQKQPSWLSRWRQWVGSPSAKEDSPPSDELQRTLGLLRRGEAILIDVREQPEWEQGHVPGAWLLPLSRLQSSAEQTSIQSMLPKEKVIVAHCIKGKRSLAAVGILRRWGYQAISLSQNAQELIVAGFDDLKSTAD